jgi:hypothetical protein
MADTSQRVARVLTVYAERVLPWSATCITGGYRTSRDFN